MLHKWAERCPNDTLGSNVPQNRGEFWGLFEAYLRLIWDTFEHIWAYLSTFEAFPSESPSKWPWIERSDIMAILANSGHSVIPWDSEPFGWAFRGNWPESDNNVTFMSLFWPLLSLFEAFFSRFTVLSGHFWRCFPRDFLKSLESPRGWNGPVLRLFPRMCKSWQKACD